MEPVSMSVLYGLGLSLIFALVLWFSWQSMKKATIIAAGSIPVKYGGGVAVVLGVLGVVGVVEVLLSLRWWALLTGSLTYFVGGWMATIVERKMYGNERTIETIVFAAQSFAQDHGWDASRRILSTVVPSWWIKLMSSGWRKKLESRLSQLGAAIGSGTGGRWQNGG